MHSAFDRIDEAMERALDINRSDLRCLNLLEHHPLTPTEIGQRLDLTSGAVTALVDRLAGRGLVVRRRSEHDRRSRVVELQPAAFQQLGGRYRLVAESILLEFEHLSDRDHGRAVETLEGLIRALQRGLGRIQEIPD
ncbi:MAG: MarR family transcriptional regulator [Acidobacteriota bacterium]